MLTMNLPSLKAKIENCTINRGKSISLQLRATKGTEKAQTSAPKRSIATTSAAMPSHTKAPTPPPLESL